MDRVKRHGNGLDSVLERFREEREPQRVFKVSLRTVLERSWSGLGAILDRSGNRLGPGENEWEQSGVGLGAL